MDNLMQRRSFLKSSALLTGGLVISFSLPARLRNMLMDTAADSKTLVPNAFLQISSDNTIKVFLAHVEMGQGVWTSLTMLIADELDVDIHSIVVEHAPASPAYKHTLVDHQLTGASTTTYTEFDRYRNAGATARWLLVEAAAKRMNVSADTCKTENGFVLSGNKKIPYGDLVNEASKLTPPSQVTLKKPSEWRYIGHSVKRLDGLPKVNGTAIFGMDVKGDGLLIATVAHAPTIGGQVISYDDNKARLVPGVTDIIKIPTGVAVIAKDYYTANKAKRLLDIKWTNGGNEKFNSLDLPNQYRKLLEKDGMTALKKGQFSVPANKGWKTITSFYTLPFLAHTPMEPLNATVKISEDKQSCEIWTGTQLPGGEQSAAAKILGIPKEQVKINTTFLGGGFGRRVNPNSDWVSEAVEIAKQTGKFIKMIWSREDDVKGLYYRPQYVHKVAVTIDQKGMPQLWHHNVAGQAIYQELGWVFNVKDGIDQSSVEGIIDNHYLNSIPNVFIGLHTTKTPVPVLWLRSVGHGVNGFVMESMVDELAYVMKKDPVEYRRMLLAKSPQALATLNLAAEKAEWGKPLVEGHYHGVAIHSSFQSHVAHIVEISLDKDNNINVHKVTCAIDCGQNVNPENIKSQMESGIIFGMTVAKYGEITITQGKVDQSNFYDYKIVRMNEAPIMDIHLVPFTGQQMGGVGETAVPPMAPALANALFRATGKRFYSLPLSSQSIQQTKI